VQSLLVGESFTYTLTVRNDGPSRAVRTVVTDRIPDGLQLESATAPCAGEPVVVCELGTLANGQQETLRFTVTAQRAGAFSNTATVTSETPDADPSDNLDDAFVEAGTRADLAIDKTVGAHTVMAGQTVVYGLLVANRGPHDATKVTVTDPLPAGMRLISASPSAGRCSGTTVLTCALGDLADGASVTIRVEAVAEQAGSTRNVASPTRDPNPRNNQDETTVTSELADLAIAKRAPRTVDLGARLTYTLTVRNDGPSAARGVVVTDPVPEGLRITATSASAGSCELVDGAVVCQLADVAAGPRLPSPCRPRPSCPAGSPADRDRVEYGSGGSVTAYARAGNEPGAHVTPEEGANKLPIRPGVTCT
jgi:uncharacterized repeat protein (TIGR01451 family)